MTLSWLKDGKDIGASSNVFVDTKRGLSTILIELVDISNAGNYTCIAKNRAGFDSLTAYLDVQGKVEGAAFKTSADCHNEDEYL